MKFKKSCDICDILKKYGKEEGKNLFNESLKQTCKIAERAGEKRAPEVDEMFNKKRLWPTSWGIGR